MEDTKSLKGAGQGVKGRRKKMSSKHLLSLDVVLPVLSLILKLSQLLRQVFIDILYFHFYFYLFLFIFILFLFYFLLLYLRFYFDFTSIFYTYFHMILNAFLNLKYYSHFLKYQELTVDLARGKDNYHYRSRRQQMLHHPRKLDEMLA